MKHVNAANRMHDAGSWRAEQIKVLDCAMRRHAHAVESGDGMRAAECDRDVALIELLMTGLRASEVCSLGRDSVVRCSATVLTKTGTNPVRIAPAVAQKVQRFQANGRETLLDSRRSSALFVLRGGAPITIRSLEKIVESLRLESGAPASACSLRAFRLEAIVRAVQERR